MNDQDPEMIIANYAEVLIEKFKRFATYGKMQYEDANFNDILTYTQLCLLITSWLIKESTVKIGINQSLHLFDKAREKCTQTILGS